MSNYDGWLTDSQSVKSSKSSTLLVARRASWQWRIAASWLFSAEETKQEDKSLFCLLIDPMWMNGCNDCGESEENKRMLRRPPMFVAKFRIQIVRSNLNVALVPRSSEVQYVLFMMLVSENDRPMNAGPTSWHRNSMVKFGHRAVLFVCKMSCDGHSEAFWWPIEAPKRWPIPVTRTADRLRRNLVHIYIGRFPLWVPSHVRNMYSRPAWTLVHDEP